ncbi:Chaperone DnaJ-domain superfamily protein [Abeliophyllum distichum]|uniref:Chaperone DnaJ-domain superfamily protein n=1 Tax=Abeliophyllum distichum TaxID=126358 RepID=A0ABD1RTZ4_9LAMI
MKCFLLCKSNTIAISPLFPNTVENVNCHSFHYCPFISASKPTLNLPLSSSSKFRVNCGRNYGNDEPLNTSLAYELLGVAPHCSSAQLKAAFRTKVKQFHPDVMKGGENSDIMIRRVIQAYEILSNYSKSEIIERECLDPFDQPECEAFDLFVNEVLCIGKGCPYSCVNRAPHAFKFSSLTGTARATSQGHGEDYQIQIAVGQCPRNCIHYVTPSQRIILEELLESIMNMPYDTSAEADLLYSLIVKAKYENNRYQRPKKQPKCAFDSCLKISHKRLQSSSWGLGDMNVKLFSTYVESWLAYWPSEMCRLRVIMTTRMTDFKLKAKPKGVFAIGVGVVVLLARKGWSCCSGCYGPT